VTHSLASATPSSQVEQTVSGLSTLSKLSVTESRRHVQLLPYNTTSNEMALHIHHFNRFGRRRAVLHSETKALKRHTQNRG
jgi:hypothetical protein